MSFFVDIVTEDSFYENLTLGVVKVLENSPCVKNVCVERRNGCESTCITSWEQRHCCVLPEDLRNFYASIDGFLLLWNIEIAGEEFPIGRMEINSLSSLKRYASVDKRGESAQQENLESELEGNSTDSEESIPALLANSRSCKMFEIARCNPESSDSKVYLVYRLKGEQGPPSLWLHREAIDGWHRLADNFTVYFRMMLVHLGLPLWQCCVAGLVLPTWAEQAYYLVGPHLLPSTFEPTETISSSLWNNGPLNVLDPAIFKGKEGKQRNARKKQM